MKHLIWVVALLSASAHAVSVYSIGNSLTWDMRPEGLKLLAENAGFTETTVGYHIRSSKTLPYIAANPADVEITNGYGGYTSALTGNAWDVLTLQTYSGSTQAADVAAFNHLRAMEPGARAYLYAAWPGMPGTYPTTSSYTDSWAALSPDSPSTPSSQTANYFDHLYEQLDDDVRLIPVGAVFARLDAEFAAGNVPGYTDSFELYRDTTHLNVVGRLVATMTTFSTIFARSAEGVTVPALYYGSLDPAFTDHLAGIVWDVVYNDARTGVAPVPLPAAGWLLLSGLACVAAFSRKRRHG